MADRKSDVNLSLEEYEALKAAAAPAEEEAPPSKPVSYTHLRAHET